MQEQTEQQLKVKQVLNLNKQVIMPTHRDLIDSRKYNLPIIPLSNHAVFVRKIASTKRATLASNLDTDKQAILGICKDFDLYDFLVNFQYAIGTIFNNAEMDYMEKVQQIAKLKNLCMNEKAANQTAIEFEQQLQSWKKRNSSKNTVPVIEPHTNELLRKVEVMKKEKVTKCAVIFRGHNNPFTRANLSQTLSHLRIAGIYSIVFGVFPKKDKVTRTSMFLSPMQFKANAISSWIPWGGGIVPVEFLNSDWGFRIYAQAEDGLADYNGAKRKELVRSNVTFNTALSRIDIVNQAGLMARNFVPLPEIEFERLFH
ncbi:MAG: hypothetical protein V1886_02570 [archaeon]